jgi:hypothetical protein
VASPNRWLDSAPGAQRCSDRGTIQEHRSPSAPAEWRQSTLRTTWQLRLTGHWLGIRLELSSPRFVYSTQQGGIHQPAAERIDQREIRPGPDADWKDVDRPEKLITSGRRLQGPNEEAVNSRIADLTHGLQWMDVQNGKGPIHRAWLDDRLPPIRLAEPSEKRPRVWFRRRAIPSK